MRVFRSEDEERKLVDSEEDNFVACFAYGEWFDTKVVDTSSMKELSFEDEYYDVSLILRQAKKSATSFLDTLLTDILICANHLLEHQQLLRYDKCLE